PGWDFTATLTQVASKFEGAQLPAVVGLNGRIHLSPTRLELHPTTFTLCSGQASLEANADSITPLQSAFTFKADSLQLSQIVPSRPPGEFVKQLVVSGTARGELSAPVINARIISGSGLVERLAYDKLDITSTYAGNRVSAQPLSVEVFNGSVLANVNAVLADRPPFDASANLRHINVGELFRWLDVHSNTVSGYLTVDGRVSGAGKSWKEIQPTLRSNGRMFLSGGELHGVNIVAIALNKIAVAPVVSQLVGVAFRSSHQQVFDSSNTDLRQASMTFSLYGQRIDTNDLLIQSPDYQITGAGWFDLDKNINMTGDIKLTLGLSAAIPVVVIGKYPALLVLPDIPKVAERTAIGVVSAPVNIIKGGANAVGNIFGGFRSILP
ncbi:MAG TPA: AsmA-like C-terminal region-containing protein, partial [Candidatus Binataceae bacterium]